jgi:hypothetical protein
MPRAYKAMVPVVEPLQRGLPLAHDLWLERADPVAGHVDLHLPGALGKHRLGPGAVAHVPGLRVGLAVLLRTQALGQLLIQRRLHHRLGQLLQ